MDLENVVYRIHANVKVPRQNHAVTVVPRRVFVMPPQANMVHLENVVSHPERVHRVLPILVHV